MLLDSIIGGSNIISSVYKKGYEITQHQFEQLHLQKRKRLASYYLDAENKINFFHHNFSSRLVEDKDPR